MKCIFLDFDGVLNPTLHKNFLKRRYEKSDGRVPSKDRFGYFFDPYCVENLERVIDETGVKDIVVVSSWRRHVDVYDLWKTRGLPGKIIGKTESFSEGFNDDAFHERGKELDKWFKDNGRPKEFCILDDRPEIYTEAQQKFIAACNSKIGLTEDVALKAIEILS